MNQQPYVFCIYEGTQHDFYDLAFFFLNKRTVSETKYGKLGSEGELLQTSVEQKVNILKDAAIDVITTLQNIMETKPNGMLDFAEAFCRKYQPRSYSTYIIRRTCECILKTKTIHPTTSATDDLFYDKFKIEDSEDDTSDSD
jgi:hypothetical protein